MLVALLTGQQVHTLIRWSAGKRLFGVAGGVSHFTSADVANVELYCPSRNSGDPARAGSPRLRFGAGMHIFIVTEKPRLQIVSVDPLTFRCSLCGEAIAGGPAPSDLTAQFTNHIREKHPMFAKGIGKP